MVGTASTARDHGFHGLRVGRVVRETADACSIVLEVPEELGAPLHLRVRAVLQPAHPGGRRRRGPLLLDVVLPGRRRRARRDGQAGARRGGLNWLNDHLHAGDLLEVSLPGGFFRLTPTGAPLVAFAAGSGITPIFSLMKTALATTGRTVRLLYANRDQPSVIFARSCVRWPGATPSESTWPITSMTSAGSWTPKRCEASSVPPDPTTCSTSAALHHSWRSLRDLARLGVAPSRVHIERFTPAELPKTPVVAEAPAEGTRVTIELDGRTQATDHHPGATILQTARQMGMTPPFSCEAGSCATCMAKLIEGEV